MKIVITQKDYVPFIWLYFPFKKEEIDELKDTVDWGLLSNNESIKWDYHLVKEYEQIWDWDALQNNRSVFRKLSLHLLFTDKVESIVCDCDRKLDNCDCITEYDIWKLYYRSRADMYFNVGYERYEEKIGRIKTITQHFLSFDKLKKVLKTDFNKTVVFNFD